MDKYSKTEISDALKIISSTISKCEKMLPKFEAGSSQHSLLQNRLKAMYISKALILDEPVDPQYSKADLENALLPVNSILQKCITGQEKHPLGTPTFVRLQKIIDAMNIAKTFIQIKIS